MDLLPIFQIIQNYTFLFQISCNKDNNKKFPNNSKYNHNDKKKSNNNSKPSFTTNLSKGNLNKNSKINKDKKNDEEFRKSREKFHFKDSINLKKGNLNKEVKNVQKPINKGIINDEDYIANFNFGEVDDDQIMQQIIEQSIIDQKMKTDKCLKKAGQYLWNSYLSNELLLFARKKI